MSPRIKEVSPERVTVGLYPRQLVFFDELALNIRKKSGQVVKRSELIRALADGLIDSGLDLSKAESEDDCRTLIAKKLKRRR